MVAELSRQGTGGGVERRVWAKAVCVGSFGGGKSRVMLAELDVRRRFFSKKPPMYYYRQGGPPV